MLLVAIAVAICAVVYLGYNIYKEHFSVQYSESQAATTTAPYAGVLAEIQATTSFQGILTLAAHAGLHIAPSVGDGVQGALISDPHSGVVLAAVTVILVFHGVDKPFFGNNGASTAEADAVPKAPEAV